MVVVHVADEQRHLADLAGEVVQRLQAFRHELRLENKVARWVADERELRRHHQLRAGLQALAVGGEDAFRVAGEVSDDRVDLGEADFHARTEKTPAADMGKRKNIFSESGVRAKALDLRFSSSPCHFLWGGRLLAAEHPGE